jgi:hypothetical protein
MHTMRYQKEDRLWTVGFVNPDNTWHALYDFDNQGQAAAMVNYLNGGKFDNDDDYEAILTKPAVMSKIGRTG